MYTRSELSERSLTKISEYHLYHIIIIYVCHQFRLECFFFASPPGRRAGGTRVEITKIVPMYKRYESSERSFTNISEFPLRPKRRKKYQTGEMR